MKRAYGKWFTRQHAVKIAGIGLMGATSGASAEAMNSQLRDSCHHLSSAALQETVPALAGPSQQDGAASRSRRGKLPRRRSACRAQSPDLGGDSGMGRAAAIAYAREGADIAINYLPVEEPDARDVIALIKAAGRTGLAIAGDIRDEAFCQELVARAVEGLGGLDIVVNNAGRQQTHASILEISTEQFDWTMKTNILRAILDHQGGPAAFEAGIGNHRHCSEQAYDPSPDLYDYAQTYPR